MSVTTEAKPAPSTFAEAEVALAESLQGYESRPQQQTLALAVETALASRSGALLAEAGCGTGKSLGYLIPAIVSGKRVIVSTATKALQDQVANKDLPFLAEHLGKPFTYALLKGRSNYACMAKMTDADVQAEAPAVAQMRRHSRPRLQEPTFAGERDDFAGLDDADWRKVTTSCRGVPRQERVPLRRRLLRREGQGPAPRPPTSWSSTTRCSSPTSRPRDETGGDGLHAGRLRRRDLR